MAIKDLNKDFTLIQQWNSVVNAQIQAVAWTNMTGDAITAILANPDYALNVSPEETAYINALQVQYQQFAGQQPQNPDR